MGDVLLLSPRTKNKTIIPLITSLNRWKRGAERGERRSKPNTSVSSAAFILKAALSVKQQQSLQLSCRVFQWTDPSNKTLHFHAAATKQTEATSGIYIKSTAASPASGDLLITERLGSLQEHRHNCRLFSFFFFSKTQSNNRKGR